MRVRRCREGVGGALVPRGGDEMPGRLGASSGVDMLWLAVYRVERDLRGYCSRLGSQLEIGC